MSFPKRLLCLDAVGDITAYTEYADYSSIAKLGCLYEFTDSIIPYFLPNPQRKKGRILTCHDPTKYPHSEWHVFGVNEGGERLSDPFSTRPARVQFKSRVQ